MNARAKAQTLFVSIFCCLIVQQIGNKSTTNAAENAEVHEFFDYDTTPSADITTNDVSTMSDLTT